MNTNTFDSIYAGNLSKRATIRRMWLRAISGQTVDHYNKKYVARRISKTVDETRQIVRWMSDHNMINATESGANFVFSF